MHTDISAAKRMVTGWFADCIFVAVSIVGIGATRKVVS